MRLIDADVLYKQVAESEEKARDRFLATTSSLPCPSYINPAYTRYNEQLNERKGEAMTNFQLHIKPCPYCGQSASIERALYYQDGTLIPKDAPHDMWLAKCSECGARTEYMPTRLSAIFAWNRGEFNGLTHIMHLPRNTQSTEPYEQLAGAIFRVAFDDYKDAYKAKLLKHEPGAPQGEHALVKSIPYLKQRAQDEAKYDIWRDRMNCTHCAAKPSQCRHKTGDYWREFKHGTAPLCIKDELMGDGKT